MSKKDKSTAIRLSKGDIIMDTVITTVMVILFIIVLYPMVYVLSSAFSSGKAVSNGKVLLWPVEPSVQGFKIIFSYKKVWTGYYNTIVNTVVATTINIFATVLVAYPMSRRDMQGKGFYMAVFMITMWFGGGLIPTYINMSNLGLTNTRWAVIMNSCISTYNMIVMRTFFKNSIPGELHDAARVDGISDIGYLFKIVLPLSKAIFSVIILYYAVGHWNSYFSAMIYIRDINLLTLQQVLRDILNASNINLDEIEGMTAEELEGLMGAADLIKYALIVVSSGPILCVYPFIQKYFERGVMIGSVKG